MISAKSLEMAEDKDVTDDVTDALQACAATYELNGLPKIAAGIRTLLASKPAATARAEPVAHFINDSAPGMKPHYSQISEQFKDHKDVFALYAAPLPASTIGRVEVAEPPCQYEVKHTPVRGEPFWAEVSFKDYEDSRMNGSPVRRVVGPCQGMNCGCTDGVNHSPECFAEHAATIAGGRFVKTKLAWWASERGMCKRESHCECGGDAWGVRETCDSWQKRPGLAAQSTAGGDHE